MLRFQGKRDFDPKQLIFPTLSCMLVQCNSKQTDRNNWLRPVTVWTLEVWTFCIRALENLQFPTLSIRWF